MRKSSSLIAIAIATTFVAVVSVQPSDAAAWHCGKKRCFWQTDYNGPVPEFAAAWGAPESQDCYYVLRSLSKKWRKVCPGVPWQAH